MTESLLEKAYRRIINLEPITPNASPTKKDRFAEEASRFNQLVGQMHCHLTGILAASDVNEGNYEWREPPPSPTREIVSNKHCFIN